MYRRTRKPNYSHEETMVLLEQIEFHRHILFGKATNHRRAEQWAIIADAVNAVPNSAGRTVEELKHRWKDMSHRARITARKVCQARASNEETVVTPSIYFDMIMRILGEDVPGGSVFDMPSDNNSQSLGSGFLENNHNSPGNSEVDIKPDIDVINGFLNRNSNTPRMNISTLPSAGFLTHNLSQNKNSTTVHHRTDSVQSNICELSRTSSNIDEALDTQFSGSCNQKSMGHSLHEDYGKQNSGQTVSKYTPSRNLSLCEPHKQTPSARPMRLDPVTQQVIEIGYDDLDCDTSEDGSLDSKLTLSVAGDGLDVSDEETADDMVTENAKHQQHLRKKRSRDMAGSSLLSWSLEELRKIYLAKKIRMVNQRFQCFKLLEQKLQLELNLMQQQAKAGHGSSYCTSCNQPESSELFRRKFRATYLEGKSKGNGIPNNVISTESKNTCINENHVKNVSCENYDDDDDENSNSDVRSDNITKNYNDVENSEDDKKLT